jgi:hypothetical protein
MYICHIHLAEVSEIMLPNELLPGKVHGRKIQVLPPEKIFVFSSIATKPVPKETKKKVSIQYPILVHNVFCSQGGIAQTTTKDYKKKRENTNLA